MNFIFDIFKGIALGAGCILPGISSGVLCVIFGIYEKLVDSILNIFKDFKRHFLFLFPIFIGIIIGVLLFGNILNFLFANFENKIKYVFAGLILGSIPSLFKETNTKNKFKINYIFYTITTFLLSILLIFIENSMTTFGCTNINFLFLFISGFLMSIGVVFPGVSSTIILMCLGVYGLYLDAVSTINLSLLIPMGCGLVIGCIVFLNIINFFMKNCYSQTMYSIIGFTIGSTFILLPNNFSITNILFLFLGFAVSLFFSNLNKKKGL